jgi:hypothetical protein
MKLFISYSRDDKAWVYELWRALRDRAHHDAWIDQRLLPAQDWWASILENVENCECCIYVMSPMSVQSIYCLAEVRYALALGKPVLPLMLKSTDVPAELTERRIQYLSLNDKMSLGEVLFEIERGLGDVRIGLLQNRFPSQMASRPLEPKPQSKQEQAKEVYLLAEDAYEQNNQSLAEKLWKQVIVSDPQRWGKAAQERLDNLIRERECGSDYQTIATMLEKGQIKAAQAAWRVYLQTCGADYDPRGIADYLAELEAAAKLHMSSEPIIEEIAEPERYEPILTKPEPVQPAPVLEEKPKVAEPAISETKKQPEKAKKRPQEQISFSRLIVLLGTFVILIGLGFGVGYWINESLRLDAIIAYRVVSEASLSAGDAIPVPSWAVILTVTGKIGTTNIEDKIQMDIATIESLGQVDYTVTDPFEGIETTFRGVLMSDLLDLWQVSTDATTLHVVALNDYAIDVPISDLRTYPVIFALKANGEYLPVSTVGPARLVYPYGEYALDPALYNDFWIWQIKSIEVR